MTTSTSSADATALPDRRHFLSTISAVGALGLAALPPAFAGEAGPTERLHAEHVRLAHAYDVAIEATWDAEARYEEPERPRWHPFHEEGGFVTIETSPGRGVPVLDDGDKNIAYLRGAIAAEHEPDDPNAGFRNKVRARRARKTLAKIEAWKAEAERRADAAGLTQAEAAEALAGAAVHEHAAKIFAIEPTNFRELAFRAAILLLTANEVEEEKLPEQLIALAGIAPHHRPDGWEG